MSFFSTRGRAYATASQAILAGIAPDGGLYVPAMFPRLEQQEIANLSRLSYAERARKILMLYLEDFTSAEVGQATAAAYGGVVRIDPRDGMYVLRIIFQPPDTSQDEKTTT